MKRSSFKKFRDKRPAPVDEIHYTPYDIIWEQIRVDGIKYSVLHKPKKNNKDEWITRAIVKGVEDTNVEELTIPESVEFCDITFPVTWIGHIAFRNCFQLRKVHFPKTLQVIEMAAFFGCHNLDSVVLPDDFERIASEAFAYCHNLKLISVKNQSEISIGEDVFIGCNKNLIVINRDEEQETK